MNRALILGILLAGCGQPDDGIETDVIGVDGKDDNTNAAKKALPDGARHLYFGTPAAPYLDDNGPIAYSWFTASKGSEFKILVGELDENGNAIAGEHIGFKLQRAVKRHGTWSWSVIAQADSDSGVAGVKWDPKTGPGLYLVTATASPLPAQLSVSLACSNDSCATARQPGAACGGLVANACDDGLYCAYSIDQACGAGDQQGVCTLGSRFCPLFIAPVCGCNGHTYGNSCQASTGGTSIDRVGPCAVDIVGNWSFVSGNHYVYTFNADGTFTSENDPGCMFTSPHCEIAVQPASGVYHIIGTTLSMTYTSDYRSGETAQFSIGGSDLTGTDWNGIAIDLTQN
jgi:hypothetical protein